MPCHVTTFANSVAYDGSRTFPIASTCAKPLPFRLLLTHAFDRHVQGSAKTKTLCKSFKSHDVLVRINLYSSHTPSCSAVNAAYRVGGFGFFASDELLAEGEPANAGLLDSRLAYDWIKANIDK